MGTYAERVLIDGNLDNGFLDGWEGNRLAFRQARAIQRKWRIAKGFKSNADVLGRNQKLDKSRLETWGLSLKPAKSGGVRRVNVCPWATPGCLSGCLQSAGNGRYDSCQEGRVARTEFLFEHPYEHGVLMGWELARRARKHGRIGFRPNVLSDLRWELIMPRSIRVIVASGKVLVYDYTKASPSERDTLNGIYDLTYSAHEKMSDADIVSLIEAGHNVAVPVNVTPSHAMPAKFLGMPAIDGDKTDLRSEDPAGVAVLLRAKGDARGSDSGFVREIA